MKLSKTYGYQRRDKNNRGWLDKIFPSLIKIVKNN